VFLEIDPTIAAERILKDAEKNPARSKEVRGNFDTVEHIVSATAERLGSERKRFRELYGIADQTAHENFDLVIDTTIPMEEVAQKIVSEYTKWLAS
jgi:cytidylate kinase